MEVMDHHLREVMDHHHQEVMDHHLQEAGAHHLLEAGAHLDDSVATTLELEFLITGCVMDTRIAMTVLTRCVVTPHQLVATMICALQCHILRLDLLTVNDGEAVEDQEVVPTMDPDRTMEAMTTDQTIIHLIILHTTMDQTTIHPIILHTTTDQTTIIHPIILHMTTDQTTIHPIIPHMTTDQTTMVLMTMVPTMEVHIWLRNLSSQRNNMVPIIMKVMTTMEVYMTITVQNISAIQMNLIQKTTVQKSTCMALITMFQTLVSISKIY